MIDDIKQHVFERIRFHVRQAVSELSMSRAVDVDSYAEHHARSMVYELQAKLWGRKSRTTKRVGYGGLQDIVNERARKGVQKELDAMRDELDAMGRGILEDIPEKMGVEVETEKIEILDPKTLEVIPDHAQHYTINEMMDEHGWLHVEPEDYE